MQPPYVLFAISGSTRRDSSNGRLIHTLAALGGDAFVLHLFEGIDTLPHFHPDRNIEDVPAEVQAFRAQLAVADAVLICTPEYAHGVPGALKNAIDWAVSSGSFSGKPTALVTASTDGRFGHASLLETLRTIEARGVDGLSLLVPFVRTRIDAAGRITDETLLAQARALMTRLHTEAAAARAGAAPTDASFQ